MSDIRRTRSLVVLPSYTPRDYTYGLSTSYRVSTSPSLYTVRRGLSSPDLYTSYRYLPEYRPSFYRYYRDWDLRDDYWYDRRYYTSYRYWPYYGWPYRKYYYSSLDYSYPWSYYNYRPYWSSSSSWSYDYDRPRYLSSYYYDYFDTWYWKRRLDPYWYRPWSYYSWPNYRPWAYESAETDRAWDMYRKGMIGYNTLDRYYLSPSTWYHRYSDYLKPYRPPITYSSYPHYMYSIDYR